jgi:ATP-dependent RNA helicase SUPV3L1/SUV3
LPKRSAVVAFSANRVYELAERVRQKHGGAAVVLGALSPRARNAQVALYQAGEVDYLVATDAIGMGLNLDIHHVAFADLQKFDGREMRLLEPAELGQIAGRAGRYLNDGTFGTLAPLSPMPEALSRSIETHSFPGQKSAWWRNDRLDFSTIESLVASLSERPRARYLKLVERAEDFEALCQLVKRDEVRANVRSPEKVELLWEVCRIPDYRGLLLEYHAGLLLELFLQLCGRTGRIEADFAAERIARLNDTEGDIDTLLARMAFIRTWTYISNQSSWIADAAAWQAETRAVEDRLSDALHERLVQKFVDRGAKARARPAAMPARRSQRRLAEPESEPAPGNPFQRLSALRDELLRKESGAPVTGEDTRVNELVNRPHEHFTVDERGRIFVDGEPVAKMTRGADLLHPEVSLLMPELGAGARLRIQRRLVAFTRDLAGELLSPLRQSALAALPAPGRGLVYQLERGLGTISAETAAAQLGALSELDRALFERAGVRFGPLLIFIPALLAPRALVQRGALWCAYTGEARALGAAPPSLPIDARLSHAGHMALGYPIFGKLALRADVVARVHALLRRAARRGAFRAPLVLARKLDCSPDALPALVRAFGYVPAGGGRFVRERGAPLLEAAGNKP